MISSPSITSLSTSFFFPSPCSNVGTNALTGTIPPELGNLTSVASLYTSPPAPCIALPFSCYLLYFHLHTSILADNQLTGTIPTQLMRRHLGSLFLLSGGNNFCPMTDYSTWASQTDYPGTNNCTACANYTCQNNGTCSGGVGQLFTCSCASGYDGVNCQDLMCPAIVMGNVQFPPSPPGLVSQIQCVLGYSGTGQAICTQVGMAGEWSNFSTACVEVFCPAATMDNAQWPGDSVQAGTTGFGICSLGTAGQVSAPCLQNGTQGYWGNASGSCSNCPPGTYQNLLGQVQCKSCPPNSISPSGANSSSQCTCLSGYTLVSSQCEGWKPLLHPPSSVALNPYYYYLLLQLSLALSAISRMPHIQSPLPAELSAEYVMLGFKAPLLARVWPTALGPTSSRTPANLQVNFSCSLSLSLSFLP